MVLEVFSHLSSSVIPFYDLSRKTQDSKGHDEAELHLAMGKKCRRFMCQCLDTKATATLGRKSR